MPDRIRRVTICTDGACSGNPGSGGWGASLTGMDSKGIIRTRYISGYEAEATNNRMELMAAIMGLESLKERCRVTLHSDSQYLVYTMSRGWSRKKNQDLWSRLDRLSRKHEIDWHWVRGHSTHAGNNKVDELAVRAIKERKGVDYRS
jgi:ribonuclease HI